HHTLRLIICSTSLTPSLSLHASPHLLSLHSFPTRRSSDLLAAAGLVDQPGQLSAEPFQLLLAQRIMLEPHAVHAVLLVILDLLIDRKSTRPNSSHLGISYAVFCLKKKKL